MRWPLPCPHKDPFQPKLHFSLWNGIPSKISLEEGFLSFRLLLLLLLFFISKHSPVRKAHYIKFYIFVLWWPSYFLFIIWHLYCLSLPSVYPWRYCGDTLPLHVTFCTCVQPLENFFFCYWHRINSRNWPTFLACLPIPFPGRILVLGCGTVTQGSTKESKGDALV